MVGSLRVYYLNAILLVKLVLFLIAVCIIIYGPVLSVPSANQLAVTFHDSSTAMLWTPLIESKEIYLLRYIFNVTPRGDITAKAVKTTKKRQAQDFTADDRTGCFWGEYISVRYYISQPSCCNER